MRDRLSFDLEEQVFGRFVRDLCTVFHRVKVTRNEKTIFKAGYVNQPMVRG